MVERTGAGWPLCGMCLVLALAACGRGGPPPDPLDQLPPVEGAYGTPHTIGDLEAHIWPQMAASPDPPRDGIDYQKYQDRRERINNVEMRVPVQEPEALKIRFFVESRNTWELPVAVRSRIYVETIDPLTRERHRAPIESHACILTTRPQLEDSPALVFDYMPHRQRFGDVVTLIAESEVLYLEPGTPAMLADPLLATAPPEARTRITSNPVRIEFERRLLPQEQPVILLPKDDAEPGIEDEETEADEGI